MIVCNTCILQLQINGVDGGRVPTRQLHIAYHNGDHYSSVRKLNDNTEAPNNIKLAVSIEIFAAYCFIIACFSHIFKIMYV